MPRSSSIGQAEKNAWQAGTEKDGRDIDGSGGDNEPYAVNRSAVNHRRSRVRYIIAFITFLLAITTLYNRFIRSPTEDKAAVSETPENMYDPSPTDGKYGINARPDFANMIKVKDLDDQFVPSTGKDRRAGRLIVVGDVHGMKEELIRLLDKVSFRKKKDHLILVGDLITKGPDSLGVVNLAMELEASAVRGNHEDRVLLAHDEMKNKMVGMPGPYEDPSKEDDDMEEVSWNHGDYEDRALAKSLSEAQLAWLKKLPVILRVGKLPGMGEVVVVHAGLVAGISLEDQDPFHAMNMRTIDMHSHVPSEARDGTSWCKVYHPFLLLINPYFTRHYTNSG